MLIDGIIELQDTNIREQARELEDCVNDLSGLMSTLNSMNSTTWQGAGADAFLAKKSDLTQAIGKVGEDILNTVRVIHKTLEAYEQAEDSAKQTIYTFGGGGSGGGFR